VRLFLYLLRWQCSTPILAIVVMALSNYSAWIGTAIANLVGGLIFYWVDRRLFDQRR